VLLFLAYLKSAMAASVAVVDFQSFGVSYDDSIYATEGVRTAILMSGDLELLSGSDVAAGVSASVEADLRAAREHAADARRLYLVEDYDGAVQAANVAVQEHRAAFSQIGRRPELADAWYTLGLACIKTGLTTDAAAAFAEVIALYPDYLSSRASNVPGSARAMMEEAAQSSPGPSRISAEQVAQVRSALNVDWVVTGSVDAGGELVARLWGPDDADAARIYTEVSGNFVPVPVPETSEVYDTIAASIARAAVVKAVVPAAEPEPAPVAVVEAAPRQTGLTQKWWFWTGAAALAGGGALVGYALWEPAPYVIPGPDTWSVRIDGL